MSTNTLRLSSVEIVDSTNIIANFTDKLTTSLSKSNVLIESNTLNVPNPKVNAIKVNGSTIEINCLPLTPYAAYKIIFRSTLNYPFKTINGQQVLIQDGVGNSKLIIGPPEPKNEVRDGLNNYLRDNIYNKDDNTTVVSKLVNSYANNISKLIFDARQLKNENYLEQIISNEEKIRGAGPFDRLNEEAAYQVLRVALTPSDQNKASDTQIISNFPWYPVTLQNKSILETLTSDSVDESGIFNINTLVLNLKNYPVTKLKSVKFALLDKNYLYDIEKLGYQIKDNTYDQEYGFRYELLADYQIKLNSSILNDPNFNVSSIVNLTVEYEYKNLSKLPYADSLTIANVIDVTREVVPPVVNIFDLKHAPIVDANNNIYNLGGVSFIDANSLDTSKKHPAFLYELPFRLDNLPSKFGQYSVDYNTGRVYVYGASQSTISNTKGFTYYLNNSNSAESPTPIGTWKQLSTSQSSSIENSATKELTNDSTYYLVTSFLSDVNNPNMTNIAEGQWYINLYAKSTSITGSSAIKDNVYFRVNVYTWDGINKNIISTGPEVYLTSPDSISKYVASVYVPNTPIDINTRIGIDIEAGRLPSSPDTVQNFISYFEGVYNSNIETTVGEYINSQIQNNSFIFQGTGDFPPVATYKYRFTYQDQIDYVYDSDSKDLVSLPYGNLRDNKAIINFNYEGILVEGKDYKANVHKEVLQERIQNRLLDLGTLRTENNEITNVFRVYNETSGEIYNVIRWSGDKVYFNYNIPPRLNEKKLERANFELVLNEVIIPSETLNNTSSLRVFKILLNNSNIISLSEDSIGSFTNTSVIFSNTSVFNKEKYYNRYLTDQENYNNLTQVSEYCIDYQNGIIYCAVSANQLDQIGTVSYKKDNIITSNQHIISVDDLYYQISDLNPKNKSFSYLAFEDHSIVPENLDYSDEQYLNNNKTYPYILYGNKVGIFDQTTFFSKVTNQIKSIRGVFEYEDFNNNTSPLNFADVSSFIGNSVTVSPINYDKPSIVEYNAIDGYYVTLPIKTEYLSSNIIFNISVIRITDNAQLWDSGGTIIPGNSIKLKLSGVNSPNLNDRVQLTVSISINDLSRIIIDYNKGDFYVDYTYLADEIIISYEYGDNVLDFRESSLPKNTTYYVTYKVGGLRDSLLNNFGSLLFIPELNTFNVGLDRERYRDALQSAMTSFFIGPTVNGIKNLVSKITHIDPEIIESVFNNWSLGTSLLYPAAIDAKGQFDLLPAKFNNGVLIDGNQTITVPASSNISLEQGTFESWVVPQWNGLDNDATINIKIYKNNSLIDTSSIFLGQNEIHPQENSFSLVPENIIYGVPQKNKNGIFIYYTNDPSNLFNRWFVEIIDNNLTTSTYKLEISSEGKIYDYKFIDGSSESSTTTNKKIIVLIDSDPLQNKKFTFIAGNEHYLLDVGKEEDKNRISIFKDVSGYLNFKVIDRDNNSYSISNDISNWKKGESHFIAASWKLNTMNNRDEMHLFIDGFEVPNIIKYGEKLFPYPHEKFRTVNPEFVLGPANKNIVGSVDLSVTQGSPIIKSTTSINFTERGIVSGDKIWIEDPLFNSSGYLITNVNGSTLTLNTNMPVTLDGLKYSINKTKYVLYNDIAVYPNTSITTDGYVLNGNDLSITSNSLVVSSPSFNLSNADNLKVGYLLKIYDDTYIDGGYVYTILEVDLIGNQITVDKKLSSTNSGITFYIYPNQEQELSGPRALIPDYNLSVDDNFRSILTIYNGVNKSDLIKINTLGLNFRAVNMDYYVWGNQTENIIQTTLPSPISLNDVKVNKVILPKTIINKNNSSVSGNTLTFTAIPRTGEYFPGDGYLDPLSNSSLGRTLLVEISGTNNVNFSSQPVSIYVEGVDWQYNTISETITLDNYGSKETLNKYIKLNLITLTCDTNNLNKDCLVFKVKEKYSITYAEDNDALSAVIKYSYEMDSGTSLVGFGGDVVVDGYGKTFSSLSVGNVLIIKSPLAATGYYKIIAISDDKKALTIQNNNSYPIPAFTDGEYKILNVTDSRTGLQNGFFTFQQNKLSGTTYLLDKGYYEFNYHTYLTIKMNPFTKENIFIGSDIRGNKQINAVLDQVKIESVQLTDTRKGEIVVGSERSITKDYYSLIPLRINKNTLLLASFDSYPFINQADYYIKYLGGNFIKSGDSVNKNFQDSVVFNTNPLILDNDGIINKNQGTIEFWINSIYDANNDPNYRYYFDAYGAKVVKAVSQNNSSIIINEKIGKVISVTMENDAGTDYFAGGKVETSVQDAIVEESYVNNSMVTLKYPVLQVISAVIDGDKTNTNYFENGAIGSNKKTIYLTKPLPQNVNSVIVTYKSTFSGNKLNSQVIKLNKKLPKDNTHVLVKFIPSGFKGDRLSIYKDDEGYLNFEVIASGENYSIRTPVYWEKNTWHRIVASYIFNSQKNKDEMRLFIDGYERDSIRLNGNISLGLGLNNFSSPTLNSYLSNQSINFTDTINQLYIGSDYNKSNIGYCLMDNFKISNISKEVYAPYGEALDPNYSSNLSMVFPQVNDLYTTYIFNFDALITKNKDFAMILAKEGAAFDFTLNIFDSFGIVSSSDLVKQILEKLIKEFKPANSRSYINYIA